MPSWQDEYVKSGHGRCPVCHSDQIEGGDWEVWDGKAEQEAWCCDCDAEWVDLYELKSICMRFVPERGAK